MQNIDTTEITDMSCKITLPDAFVFYSQLHEYTSQAILTIETNSVTCKLTV